MVLRLESNGETQRFIRIAMVPETRTLGLMTTSPGKRASFETRVGCPQKAGW